MTKEKTIQVFERYRSYFTEIANGYGWSCEGERSPTEHLFAELDSKKRLLHMIYCCEQGIAFMNDAEDRTEKAMRWLGFIQGYLWVTNAYTISELGQHNMPPAEATQEPSV